MFAGLLAFTAAQAAQKSKVSEYSKRSEFTAAQAAQKRYWNQLFGIIGFTAAQAAQKLNTAA